MHTKSNRYCFRNIYMYTFFHAYVVPALSSDTTKSFTKLIRFLKNALVFFFCPRLRPRLFAVNDDNDDCIGGFFFAYAYDVYFVALFAFRTERRKKKTTKRDRIHDERRCQSRHTRSARYLVGAASSDFNETVCTLCLYVFGICRRGRGELVFFFLKLFASRKCSNIFYSRFG